MKNMIGLGSVSRLILFNNLNNGFTSFNRSLSSRPFCRGSKEKVFGGVLTALGLSGGIALYHAKKVKVSATNSGEPLCVNQFMAPPISSSEYLEKTRTDMKTRMELLAMDIQATLCRSLEQQEDEGKFKVERLSDKEGEGKIMCTMEDEGVVEKAVISVYNLQVSDSKYVGINSIIYPRNPNISTLKFQLAYLECHDEGHKEPTGLFVGKIELIPYVYNEEDFKNYHSVLKGICSDYNRKCYEKFKTQCDRDNFISHMGECLGVGGLCFSLEADKKYDVSFEFVKACAENVMSVYISLVQKHNNDLYTYKDRQWQLMRRGQHTETIIGAKGQGHLGPVDDGLASLPLMAKWSNNYKIHPGSKEEKLMEILKEPREWA